jgi:hypothetical protein
MLGEPPNERDRHPEPVGSLLERKVRHREPIISRDGAVWKLQRGLRAARDRRRDPSPVGVQRSRVRDRAGALRLPRRGGAGLGSRHPEHVFVDLTRSTAPRSDPGDDSCGGEVSNATEDIRSGAAPQAYTHLLYAHRDLPVQPGIVNTYIDNLILRHDSIQRRID